MIDGRPDSSHHAERLGVFESQSRGPCPPMPMPSSPTRGEISCAARRSTAQCGRADNAPSPVRVERRTRTIRPPAFPGDGTDATQTQLVEPVRERRGDCAASPRHGRVQHRQTRRGSLAGSPTGCPATSAVVQVPFKNRPPSLPIVFACRSSRSFQASTTGRIAAMCSGVVPQQPPIMRTPAARSSGTRSASA